METLSRSLLQAPKKHSNCRKGQNTTKRELIDSGTAKRYVRRDQDRRLKASGDVGKLLADLTKDSKPDLSAAKAAAIEDGRKWRQLSKGNGGNI